MDASNSMNSGTNPEITSIYDSINNIFMNPSAIIILVVVVVIYLALFMSLGSSSNDTNNTNDNSSGGQIITIIIVGLFIVLAIINGFQYFLGVDIIANIKNLFSGEPEVDISVINNTNMNTNSSTVPEIKIKKQVFNIPGNTYVYPDAKALCSAYGSTLANYQQIEESYNEGGEWCNYGWSEGQMALFPTQQSTYDGLQKIPGHENDCGRPGINGGYMANPALKFGVNCYGYKPQMTPEEEELMQTVPHYPLTKKDIMMEQRVDYWKNKLTEILVSPFNYKNWSKV
jgi:hypothetical protein